MRTHIRTTLVALVMTCTTVTSAGRAAQQSPTQGAVRIAYEHCFMDLEWGGVRCDIRLWIDESDTRAVLGGVQPKWSPDGTRIVFVDASIYTNNYGEIAVVSVADPRVITYLTTLTVYPAANLAPAWSRDGRIAYVSDRTGSPELYRVNADGTGTVRLTNGIGFTGDFAWSPDGSTIALARDVGGVRDLYRMNADGSNLGRLTSNAGFAGRLAWSPGGTRLTFDCGTEVCAVNADGTGLEQLTTGTGFGGMLSPAGDRLAFATGEFGTTNQIVLKQANGQIISLAPGAPGHTPEWSPDGNRLIFQGTAVLEYSGICEIWSCVPMTGLYMVNADATDLRLVALGTNPDWFTPHPGQPVASFTEQCSSVNCVFDGSGSTDPNGAIVNYSWRFGDGTTGTGVSPGHVYASSGYYDVTLTITDQEGRTSTTIRRARANTPPVASFTFACNGPTCTFDGSGSSDTDGPPMTYVWSFGDGQIANGVVATHTFPNGSFNVSFGVRDSAGDGDGASTTVQIVNALPTASFTAVCVGLTCTFDASASTGGGDTIREYRWDTGGGSTLYGGPIISHTYFTGGTYTVTLLVFDQGWQRATTTSTVTVASVPMHVGDLDGSRTHPAPGLWNADATITVHDADHRPVPGAVVTGRWSTGSTLSCATDASGRCVIAAAYLPNKTGSVLLTILTLTHDGFVYLAGANHDPDRDSDGTSIVIRRN